MSDRIEEYGRHVRTVEHAMDAVEAAISQAEGVRSALGGTGGGGGFGGIDLAQSRYVALLEDADRLREEWEGADDLRQTLVECIDMCEPNARLVLMAALADAQRHGRVVYSRLARRLGVTGPTASRWYAQALEELEAVMREHGAL